MAAFNGKVVIIGVGGFGKSWVQRFSERRDGYEVVAIADVNPNALAAAKDALGLAPERCFTDYSAALANDADLAVIVTPPAVHCEQVISALEAGKHVVVAKPLAPTWDECVRMVRTADRQRKVLAVE